MLLYVDEITEPLRLSNGELKSLTSMTRHTKWHSNSGKVPQRNLEIFRFAKTILTRHLQYCRDNAILCERV